MVQMEETEHYDMLDDDALAPLKRNHACLQCKKRKVKCDAVCLSLSHEIKADSRPNQHAHRVFVPTLMR
jgi:hypothetical protein